MIKAVIFDMDGVLIEAKDWHFEALNRALGLFGYEISRADHLSAYDGLPTRRKLELLTIERGLPKGLHAFLNDMKQQYTVEMVTMLCRPRFCHEYALARLRSDGYRIGLASNSIKKTIDLMMEKSALTQYLDTMVSNQDVPKGKPDPAMYHLAMERLGVLPQETLIIEDNDHGVQAAIASGAHLLRVAEVTDANYRAIKDRIAELEA